MKETPRRLLSEVVKLGAEVFVASYGSTAGAAVLMSLVYPLVYLLNPHLSFHQFNRIFSVPYFPVQIVFGFAVGYLVQKRLGARFSFWVWTVPFSIFLWHFVAFEPSAFESIWQTRLARFVGSACRPPACFDQTSFTSPVYTSIAYVFGASVRQKTARIESAK